MPFLFNSNTVNTHCFFFFQKIEFVFHLQLRTVQTHSYWFNKSLQSYFNPNVRPMRSQNKMSIATDAIWAVYNTCEMCFGMCVCVFVLVPNTVWLILAECHRDPFTAAQRARTAGERPVLPNSSHLNSKMATNPPPHIPNSLTPHTVSSWGADIYVGAADIAVLVLLPLYNHSFSQIVRDSQISFYALSSYTVTPKEVRPVLLFSLFASRFLSTSARNIGFHPRRATIPTSPVKALAANWKKSATILMT